MQGRIRRRGRKRSTIELTNQVGSGSLGPVGQAVGLAPVSAIAAAMRDCRVVVRVSANEDGLSSLSWLRLGKPGQRPGLQPDQLHPPAWAGNPLPAPASPPAAVAQPPPISRIRA